MIPLDRRPTSFEPNSDFPPFSDERLSDRPQVYGAYDELVCRLAIAEKIIQLHERGFSYEFVPIDSDGGHLFYKELKVQGLVTNLRQYNRPGDFFSGGKDTPETIFDIEDHTFGVQADLDLRNGDSVVVTARLSGSIFNHAVHAAMERGSSEFARKFQLSMLDGLLDSKSPFLLLRVDINDTPYFSNEPVLETIRIRTDWQNEHQGEEQPTWDSLLKSIEAREQVLFRI